MKLSRILLLGVIATLCLAALMGLVGVLAVQVVNWRLIVTDLAIGLCGLTCLGASIPQHRNAWRLCKIGTFIASGVGLALSLCVIWEFFPYPTNKLLVRAWGFCFVWSVALPVLSLLTMSRFSNGLRWARLATLILTASLAAQGSLAIIMAWPGIGDIGDRVMIATAILTSLGIISLPILHKLYGSKNPTDAVSTKLEMEIVCPRCAAHQTIAAGDSSCGNCRLKFRLEIEEPRCAGCGYLLYQLTSLRCPECGREIPMFQPPTKTTEQETQTANAK